MYAFSQPEIKSTVEQLTRLPVVGRHVSSFGSSRPTFELRDSLATRCASVSLYGACLGLSSSNVPVDKIISGINALRAHVVDFDAPTLFNLLRVNCKFKMAATQDIPQETSYRGKSYAGHWIVIFGQNVANAYKDLSLNAAQLIAISQTQCVREFSFFADLMPKFNSRREHLGGKILTAEEVTRLAQGNWSEVFFKYLDRVDPSLSFEDLQKLVNSRALACQLYPDKNDPGSSRRQVPQDIRRGRIYFDPIHN